MKSTGITRKVDELGRIVLPKEIRNSLDINNGDWLEIFVNSEQIILQKYTSGCIFCGDVDNVIFFGGKRVCPACIEKLKNQI